MSNFVFNMNLREPQKSSAESSWNVLTADRNAWHFVIRSGKVCSTYFWLRKYCLRLRKPPFLAEIFTDPITCDQNVRQERTTGMHEICKHHDLIIQCIFTGCQGSWMSSLSMRTRHGFTRNISEATFTSLVFRSWVRHDAPGLSRFICSNWGYTVPAWETSYLN